MFNNYNGKYLIVDNNYVGKVINELWDNNCVLLKLENYTDYVDLVIKNNDGLKLIEKSIKDDNKGYLIVTDSMKIENIDNGNSIKKALLLMKNIKFDKLSGEINNKFNDFLSYIFVKKENISYLIEDTIQKYDNKKKNIHEDNILKIMKKLTNEETISYLRQYNEGENIEDAAPESIIEIKKILLDNLIKQDSFDMDYYYKLDESLSYKDLIKNEKIDNISFGTEIINAIIDNLYNFSIKIKSNGKIITKDGEDTNLFKEYSIFNFLKFEIIEDYIVITDITKENRKITEELLPNLKYLKEQQYGKEINYEQLLSLLLSVDSTNMTDNNDLIIEVLKIMSQEYIIAFQPKVNLLIWNVVRLIVCWYADDELRKKIFKIKILINSFRSRANKKYNIKNGIEPLITIYPQYGKENAYLVLAYLSLYFFKFKTFGSKKNTPTFFKAIDNDSLIFYTNSSTDMKKYIKYLKDNKLSNQIFDNKMTTIDNPENNIEFTVENKSNINLKITEETKISQLFNKDITIGEVFE